LCNFNQNNLFKGGFAMLTPIESHLLDYQGNITNASVFEASPVLVSNVIATTQKWGVILEWAMTGIEARRGRGHWKAHVLLESMGPGNEYMLPSAGPVVVLNSQGVWTAATGTRTFDNIAGKLPIEIDPAVDPIAPGTYRLTTTLQYYDEADVPYPVSGFFEGPMLEFYNPGP
jgi:hypothetical protein